MSANNDSRLQRAVAEAFEEEYFDAVNAQKSEHIFSAKFEREINELISCRRKPQLHRIRIMAKRAACVAAVILIATCSTIMDVNAERDNLSHFVIRTYSDCCYIDTDYGSYEDFPKTIGNYYDAPDSLTDYIITDTLITSKSVSYSYVNYKKALRIDFKQYVKSEFRMKIEAETPYTFVKINDYDAIYYSEIQDDYRALIWDDGDYIITLFSNLDENDFFDFAKSIENFY